MSTNMKNMEKGVIFMRRAEMFKVGLLTVLLSGLLALVPIGYAFAAVSGTCVSCHTMHNSQNGTTVTIGTGTGGNSILTTTCAGCHAQGTANHVVTMGTSKVPQVYHTSATDLAGGNFGYINYLGSSKGTGASAAKGHNVNATLSALGTDGSLTAPPGDEFTTGITNANFTCGGTYGCHGNRATENELSSIKGSHHGSDASIDGSTVPKSYRFLLGVKGVENNDATNGWQNLSAAVTNKYKGASAPDTASLTSPGTNGTMSGLCAECHGKFHGSGADGHGVSGAWIRHPTDILLPTTAPYSSYDPTLTYDATVPVAYTDPSLPTRATAVVMCLSCHGVHGTNYADILRWDYSGMVAGTTGAAAGTGCFKCHSDKDGL
ncbi:MAG: cytochrome c3 family protein [Thermodesulfobacteriota bacterium]|nr:cytochrome c3 family protein [Thermodesulfobacteriota bacterium]